MGMSETHFGVRFEVLDPTLPYPHHPTPHPIILILLRFVNSFQIPLGTLGPLGPLGFLSLGPRARAHWAHSFVGPKGPGPIGPFLGDSFEEVIGFSIV